MLIPSDTCMDTVSIIAPAMAFPINIPRSDSTTNENNRYISLNNSKIITNLRDFYYRGIMLGGQREELYDETNKYEINYAFRKAWMIGNEEN